MHAFWGRHQATALYRGGAVVKEDSTDMPTGRKGFRLPVAGLIGYGICSLGWHRAEYFFGIAKGTLRIKSPYEALESRFSLPKTFFEFAPGGCSIAEFFPGIVLYHVR